MAAEARAITPEDLKHRFQFHPADDQNTKDAHEYVRQECVNLGLSILKTVPAGREQATAITNLEQVMFWANAGIARGDGPKE
jgi:hypothetical protein